MSYERFSTAITSGNLTHRDAVVMPVDYVAALSAATGLGSDLLRARDYDRYAVRRAIFNLAAKALKVGKRKRLPLSREMAIKFAEAAIIERIQRNCRKCTGAGVVMVADLKIVCPTCDGTTIHYYRDSERARMCGIKPMDWPQWSRRYEMVLRILMGHDTAVMRAEDHLGRD